MYLLEKKKDFIVLQEKLLQETDLDKILVLHMLIGDLHYLGSSIRDKFVRKT